MTRIQAAFEQFHRDNPNVYVLFTRFTFQAVHSGKAHFGAGAVWERLRWELNIATQTEDEFKLNNNHRAYYARLFMQDFPQLAGFFRTRAVTITPSLIMQQAHP